MQFSCIYRKKKLHYFRKNPKCFFLAKDQLFLFFSWFKAENKADLEWIPQVLDNSAGIFKNNVRFISP